MSASEGYTPPEFPLGTPPPDGPRPPRRSGLPAGAAIGVLAGVLVVGLVLVFTVGQNKSSGTSSLVAAPGTTSSGHPVGTGAATGPAGGATGAGPSGTGAVGGGAPTGQATNTAAGGVGGTPGEQSAGAASDAFAVGECVNLSGTGAQFDVAQASCTSAAYKIIDAIGNVSGNVNADESQCYSINGNDDEFENGDAVDGYTLYCMNSLTGDYSPRRAAVDNCVTSTGAYEVDCTSSKAAWIVIGRVDDTTNTKDCARFGSYDYSYFYTATPTFVLCVDKYSK